MFRTTDIILIAAMISAAGFTYMTKHESEALREEVGALETRIQLEKDAIDLLKADWSLLTQPSRLQKLADIYEPELALKPLEPRQVAEFDALRELPFRPVDAPVGDEIGELLRDETITGGVAQ